MEAAECFSEVGVGVRRKQLEGDVPVGRGRGSPGVLQRCRKAATGWGVMRELITKSAMRCRSHCKGARNIF